MSVARGRPRAEAGGRSGSIANHSSSVVSLSYRRPLRLYCRRVISVQTIVLSLESSQIRRNHNWLKSLSFFFSPALRLRTDNSGNRLSPSGSPLVAANLRLAGLRYVSEFSGAAGLSRLLAAKARRPAVRSHRRALQSDQACRTTRRGRSLPAALTRGRRALG